MSSRVFDVARGVNEIAKAMIVPTHHSSSIAHTSSIAREASATTSEQGDES